MSTLDLILNTHAQAAKRPVLLNKRSTIPGALPVLTAGDIDLTLRLWFYRGAPGAQVAVNETKVAANLEFLGKAARTTGSPNLFDGVGFTQITDSNGDFGYECTLNLNTAGLVALVADGENSEVFIDITEDGTPTVQLENVTVRPRTNTGGAPATPADPPYPTSSDLLTQLQHLEDDKADKTTTITGTGNLTGGGSLAANRTLDMANMTAATIKGRASGAGTGTPTDLTGTQVAAILPDASATVRGVVPVGMIPVPGAFATDDQVMTGADPRAGVPGGVNLAAGSYATSTSAFAMGAGDFSISFTIYPTGSGVIISHDVGGLNIERHGPTGHVRTSKVGEADMLESSEVLPLNTFTAVTVQRASGVSKMFFNTTEVASASDSLSYASNPMRIGYDVNPALAIPAKIVDIKRFNRALTADEIKACNKGEIPASLASLGGASQSSGSLIVGHEYRITSVAGGASFTGVGASANTVGVTFVATSTSPTWGTGSVETVGLVANFRVDRVLRSGKWPCAISGTVLVPGSGITPLDPVDSVTRVISGTVAGATVTAGTIASIGTFTPTAGYDTTAYAAIGQWDAVSGTWGQARPTNATGVITTATAAGTVTVETSALTSNATVSASTPVKITHHIV